MSTRPATPDDVIEGELLGMLVAGRQVVVGRAGGRLYAVDGVCTHQYAALEHGTLEGETVICRFHGSGFDLRSGAVVFPPATKPIESYRVSIEDGRIVVDGVPADVRIGYTGLRDRG